MILVAVDTSTRWAGAGLQIDSGERTQVVWRSEQNHGRELMPAIVGLMDGAGVTPTDVTHLAVALGPGGFSAVRVGISTVIGFAMPHDLPVVGVPTHMVEAYPYLERATEATPLVSLLPAGRSELAWSRFDSADGVPEIGLSTVDKLIARFPSGALFCGEGAEFLTGNVAPGRILSGEQPTRSPSVMLEIATDRFAKGRATPVTELRPIYARPPSITAPKRPA